MVDEGTRHFGLWGASVVFEDGREHTAIAVSRAAAIGRCAIWALKQDATRIEVHRWAR